MAPARRKQKSYHSLIFFFLAALTLVTFWHVQEGEFLVLDDNRYVANNPRIQNGMTWDAIKWAFAADLLYDADYADYWQPLTFLSRIVDFQIHGHDPGGHHLTNLIFHVLNVLLLFYLLRALTRSEWKSALAAALFAVHPVQAEVVGWVTARKDVLSVFFALITLHAYRLYVKKATVTSALIVFFLYVLAVMAKPMMLPIPFVLILLDYWPLGRIDSLFSISGLKKAFANKWRLFLIMPVLTPIALIGRPEVLEQSFVSQIPIALTHYGFYFFKIFFPYRLGLYGPTPEVMKPIWQVAGSVAVLTGCTIFVLLKSKRFPYLSTGWFWFLGSFVPIMTALYPADRFLYFPMVGLVILFVWGVSNLLIEKAASNRILFSLAVGLIVLLAFLSHVQAKYWKNGEALFTRALEVNSNNYDAHGNLGGIFLEQGKLKEAELHLKEALRLKPGKITAINNLGVALLRQGKPQQAILKYKQVLELEPDDWVTRLNLANVYMELNQHSDEKRELYRVLESRSDNTEAFVKLGLIFEMAGDAEKAREHFDKGLLAQPHDAHAHYQMGTYLFEHGKLEEGVRQYRKAIEIRPNFSEAMNNLGVLLAKQDKWRESAQVLQVALKHKPDYPEAQRNLRDALRKLRS